MCHILPQSDLWCLLLFLSAEPLAGFRAAVKRSFSKRQESVTSGGGGEFQRQTSTVSQLSQDDHPGLTDNLSRFSIEDLPVVASPSPFPGRSVFPGPTDNFEDREDETDIDVEVSVSVARVFVRELH